MLAKMLAAATCQLTRTKPFNFEEEKITTGDVDTPPGGRKTSLHSLNDLLKVMSRKIKEFFLGRELVRSLMPPTN